MKTFLIVVVILALAALALHVTAPKTAPEAEIEAVVEPEQEERASGINEATDAIKDAVN